MLAKMKVKKSSKSIFCSVCPDWEIKRPHMCSNTFSHKKTKHYFCTRKCKDRFVKAPEKFT